MIARFFNGMTSDSKHIREKVFIEEQGFKEEFDEYDDYVDTLVIYDDEMHPMATGRVYEIDNKSHTYKLGRIAVLKEYRHKGLGKEIIRLLERHALEQGAQHYYISAQVVAQSFYEKCGYTAYGDRYFEEHVEHTSMQKEAYHK